MTGLFLQCSISALVIMVMVQCYIFCCVLYINSCDRVQYTTVGVHIYIYVQGDWRLKQRFGGPNAASHRFGGPNVVSHKFCGSKNVSNKFSGPKIMSHRFGGSYLVS